MMGRLPPDLVGSYVIPAGGVSRQTTNALTTGTFAAAVLWKVSTG